MIRNSKQNWTAGQTVKVGFLSLMVLAAIPTPGDYAPDAYLLAGKNAFYQLVPHNGLTKLDASEAAILIEEAKAHAARQVAAALTKSAAEQAHAAQVKAVLDWSAAA